jgi:hypothetical protein
MNELLSAGISLLKVDVLRRLSVRDVTANVFMGPSSIA